MKKRPFYKHLSSREMHSGSGEVKEFKEKKAQMTEQLKDRKQNKKKQAQKPLREYRLCICVHAACWGGGGARQRLTGLKVFLKKSFHKQLLFLVVSH